MLAFLFIQIRSVIVKVINSLQFNLAIIVKSTPNLPVKRLSLVT